MWELDHKEGWVPKSWCFWIVVLEKTLESPLDSKEIKSVNPKGNQPWIIIGRTDAEAPVLWPLDSKSWLIGKDCDAGKDWRQEEKAATEDQMVEWHHWLCGHEFEQVPGVGDGQGSLACCSPWSCKDLVRRSNWTLTNATAILKMNSQIYFHVYCLNQNILINITESQMRFDKMILTETPELGSLGALWHISDGLKDLGSCLLCSINSLNSIFRFVTSVWKIIVSASSFASFHMVIFKTA